MRFGSQPCISPAHDHTKPIKHKITLNTNRSAVCRTQDFLMESDQIKCEQSKFMLFSSLPCTLDSVGFHENILNVIDSRCVEAVWPLDILSLQYLAIMVFLRYCKDFVGALLGCWVVVWVLLHVIEWGVLLTIILTNSPTHLQNHFQSCYRN